jgi:putative protein-disulfide isomerase
VRAHQHAASAPKKRGDQALGRSRGRLSTQITRRLKLYYIHDPMCSWCWAFRPTWARIVKDLPAAVTTERVLGGLAPDTCDPMPAPMRAYLQQTWRRIQQVVPGTPFNFNFWTRCQPRRSTYPACRAVIAAMRQGIEYEEPMILAIQQAYYLQARNPSDEDTLIELAAELGLATTRFIADLNSLSTQAGLARQIAFAQHLGAQGFPSLILMQPGGDPQRLSFDYNDATVVLDQLPR